LNTHLPGSHFCGAYLELHQGEVLRIYLLRGSCIALLALDRSTYLDLYSDQVKLIGRSLMGEELRERVKERYAVAARSAFDGAGSSSCCGSAGERGLDSEALGVDRLVALGRALSDPIRVRMLSMMADGRSCCDFSDSGVPVEEGEEGICVCEFEEVFGMGQSKVSYHMKKLKDARLVQEERRGKWAFYSLDREVAGELLDEAAARLLSGAEKRSVVGECC
jgi:ArsR family transcriptional regulator, arsenate/arsenite/antimonite-responsive transcriptional repressor